jgi:hypothetical protein
MIRIMVCILIFSFFGKLDFRGFAMELNEVGLGLPKARLEATDQPSHSTSDNLLLGATWIGITKRGHTAICQYRCGAAGCEQEAR